MQVVAVTDPLELGFARQAMVGIRVTGALEPVADALAELDEVDYVVVTAGSYDLLAEVVCESDEHLLEIISAGSAASTAWSSHRDLHVPPAAQADLLVGCALSQRLPPLSLWHETTADDWTPRPPLAGDPEADVADRGRRLHRAVDGATTSPRPTRRCGSPCSRPRSPGSARAAATAAGAPRCSRPRCRSLAARSAARRALAQHRGDARERRRGGAGRPPPRASTPSSPRAAPIALARSRAAVAPGAGRGRRRPALGPRRGRAAAARRRGGDRRCWPAPASAARRTPRTARPSTPARLVRGLADGRRAPRRHPPRADAARPRSRPGGSHPPRDRCAPSVVVRATEGYTRTLPRAARGRSVPVYSLIIATEPLPAEVWDEIGLRRRETFSDHRHLIIYGQRTADDRLVFGGRGAPYHFGSRIRPAFDRDERVFAGLHATLRRPVPGAAGHPLHPRLGRRARHRPRLVRLGRPGPRHRPGLGRRLRRRRRQHHEPRRPDPARPGAGPRHRADPAAVGRPPLPALGARAAALAGHQRRAARDDRSPTPRRG